MKQSELLTAFYLAIQSWIDFDYQDKPDWLQPSLGLCPNLIKFCSSEHGMSFAAMEPYEQELIAQFMDAGVDPSYPFNGGNLGAYYEERMKYTNPQRLAWIKEHASCDSTS